MRREIDVLFQALRKSCVIVEKSNHLVWTEEDLEDARRMGRFLDESELLPPDPRSEINGPYPGCMQLSGASEKDTAYLPAGQTANFVIFTATKPAHLIA